MLAERNIAEHDILDDLIVAGFGALSQPQMKRDRLRNHYIKGPLP